MAYKTGNKVYLSASDKFFFFKLTGSQFWRGSRKILVAQKSQRSYLKKGRGQKKTSTTGDILDRLRKMVASDAEEEDDFIETPSPEPRQSNQLQGKRSSSSTLEGIQKEAAKMLKSIFKCSICLNHCKLPAAACSACYAVIGCVHCLEQWIEASTSLAKCPLCCTSSDYAVIPMVREIANILGQPVPRGNIVLENDASDTDTIPYGHGDDDYRSDEDFSDHAPVL